MLTPPRYENLASLLLLQAASARWQVWLLPKANLLEVDLPVSAVWRSVRCALERAGEDHGFREGAEGRRDEPGDRVALAVRAGMPDKLLKGLAGRLRKMGGESGARIGQFEAQEEARERVRGGAGCFPCLP